MLIEDRLRANGQHDLIKHLNAVEPHVRSNLLRQLENLDWGQLPSLLQNHVLNPADEHVPIQIEPAPYLPLRPESADQKSYFKEARAKGKELIASGAVAAFTVAGGQGSRLGYSGPKGMFPITPITNKSLFQVFAEKILWHARRHGVAIPWYIMTSPSNHDETLAFFQDSNYFGMTPGDVVFFKQGMLPAFTPDGQLILAEEDRIFMSPDGHGGSLKALSQSGALDDMRSRGCKIISYFQVDNPLVTVLDPLFIGLHSLEQSEVSSKMIPKIHASEKMGVFCSVDGALQIIEYSDLPEALAEARDDQGGLRFVAGSPAIHLFSAEFVNQLTAGDYSLPLHTARKAIPYFDASNGIVTPTEPNGIKLETFVFDSLQFAERTLILEADRGTEFAPVKNARGKDSPESCRKVMMAMFAAWLKKYDVAVPETDEGELLCKIEISPLAAAAEEDLARLSLPDRITPNQEVYIDELSSSPISPG